MTAKELKGVEFPWEMCILTRTVQNAAVQTFWTEIFGKFSVRVSVEGDYQTKNDVKNWKEDKETCIFQPSKLSILLQKMISNPYTYSLEYFYLRLKRCKYKL